MIEAFAAAIAGVALAQASPGPNMLAIAGVALGQGRERALWTVGGIASAMFVWAAAVALGLAAVVAVFPSTLTVLKLVGGGYLLWIAVKSLAAARRGGAPPVKADTAALTRAQAWRRGFFVVLTNPKAALMWAAVGTYLFGSGLNAWQVAAFGPLAALSATLVYGTYGLLFSTGIAMRAYARFSRAIEAGLGIAFGLLGGRLVLDGLRELRA